MDNESHPVMTDKPKAKQKKNTGAENKQEKTGKHPGGRPTKYTKELASLICERLATGESMRSISRDDSMPAMSTLFSWIRDIEEFSVQYDKAKAESADALFEDMLDIADNGASQEIDIDGVKHSAVTAVGVAHAKLRVDTRKWAASKLKPKKYGEKIQQEITGKDGGALEISDMSERELARRIAFTLAKAAKTTDKVNK